MLAVLSKYADRWKPISAAGILGEYETTGAATTNIIVPDVVLKCLKLTN